MRTFSFLAAMALLLVALPASGQTLVEDQERFFLRGEGCGATEDPYLSTRSGSDGLDGCGGIGGFPFNEVFHQAGVDGSTAFSARDGLPLIVDNTRNLTGQITAEQWVGGTVSAGQVIVEVEISGTQEGSFFGATLGSFTGEAIVTPLDGDGYAFEFDLDIPDSITQAPFTSLTATVAVRGLNQNNSNLGLEGDSYFTLPTLVEEV